MKYKAYTIALLKKLGIQKMYKGCDYIVSSISFMDKNEKYFTPVTKVLYVEIAKQYNTSSLCVEKNMRSIIKNIWSKPENRKLIYEIFGPYNLEKRPSNMEFLVLLYNYLKRNNVNPPSDISKNAIDYTFMCPLSGSPCEFCKEFIIETLNNINQDTKER